MLTNCLAECAHLTITVFQIERDISLKSSFFHTPLHLMPPLGGFPSEHRHPVWYGKTRMVWLADGEKISKISLFVSNVTDTHTDKQTVTQTLHDDIHRTYASHHTAKMLFCCLWCNVETYCHKHFVVIVRWHCGDKALRLQRWQRLAVAALTTCYEARYWVGNRDFCLPTCIQRPS